MNVEIKNKIIELRNSGKGYGEIASLLNLSKSTVSSFCNSINSKSRLCPVCGVKLINVEGKKKKKFCSDKCRMTWWNNHRLEGKKTITRKCKHCGKGFICLSNSKTSYCSRACYLSEVTHG